MSVLHNPSSSREREFRVLMASGAAAKSWIPRRLRSTSPRAVFPPLCMPPSAAGEAEVDGHAIFGNRPEVVVGEFHVERVVAVIPHDLLICEGNNPAVAVAGVGGDRLAGGHAADTRKGREALPSHLKNVLQLRQRVGGHVA